MVKIKYVYRRGDTYYWQRKIPSELVERYPSSAPLKVNLKTTDPAVIAIKVTKLNKQHEALWEAMRRNPELTPQSTREQAMALLKAHGLGGPQERKDEMALSLFFDSLDEKRQAYALRQPDPEEAYVEADTDDFLSKTEQEALNILSGADTFLLSDALEVYLEEHPKRGKAGFETLEAYTRRTWERMVKFLGDRRLADVTRNDAKAFRDFLMAGLKTTSVRRNLNVIRAVVNSAIVEKTLNIPNVWDEIKIAGLGEDADKRRSYTREQLHKLFGLCKDKDDDMRRLLAIQAGTGARLGEVVGLALEDIFIEGVTIPHIFIRPHPWRTLKTQMSKRKVPLVGIALWAVQRVVESASKGQKMAFPRYCDGIKSKSSSASGALNKCLLSIGIDRTTHELRHTLRDSLRNSGATRDIQDAIGGWGQNSIADNYGEGYALAIMRDALLKASFEETTLEK